MQSIIWEAVRGLFPDKYKQVEANKDASFGILKRYQDGKLTLAKARERIQKHAGGINRPAWFGGRSSSRNAAGQRSSYSDGIPIQGVVGRGKTRLQQSAARISGGGSLEDARGRQGPTLDPPQDVQKIKDAVDLSNSPVGRENQKLLDQERTDTLKQQTVFHGTGVSELEGGKFSTDKIGTGEGAEWYSRAANQGSTAAQYRLGSHYARGQGVEKNLEEAYLWWRPIQTMN